MGWDLKLGQEDSRTALHERHKGSSSRGISAPLRGGVHHNIMLWWDPQRGEEFGYADGWTSDGSAFYFSGTGVEGDQRFTAPHAENGRVRDHVSNGDRVRLLKYVDKNLVGYVAELELEDWQWRDGEDQNGQTRKMIQFRFVPVGIALRDAEDSKRDPVGDTVTAAPLPEIPEPPSETSLEALRSQGFKRVLSVQEVVGQRREADLVHAFAEWAESSAGRAPTGLSIPYGSEGRNLRADAFLPASDGAPGVLIEAKASAARESIRMAIGQLLDYARYLETAPKLAILAPSPPPEDMLTLLEGLGIGAIWREDDGFAAHGLELSL